MKNRPFGTTGVRVSELCLGTMTFGREADEATSRAVIDHYVEAGGNFIDTADVYGGGASEEIVGRALEGRRDQVFLATKFRMRTGAGTNDAGGSRLHIRRAVEASLRRLRTDRIDLLQMHAWDPVTPLEETMSALDDLVRTGKAVYLGVSNFAAWQLAQALGVSARHGWASLASLQPEYSLVSRGAENELLPCCRFNGLAVLPWSPLGGGILTGKYRREVDPPPDSRAAQPLPIALQLRSRLAGREAAVVEAVREVAAEAGCPEAHVALSWVMHRPGVTAPIVGARTVDQLESNLAAADITLDPALISRLDEVSRLELAYPQDLQRTLGIDRH